MASPKPPSKKDLLQALRDLPTKRDVRQIVKDEVHEQMSEFHAEITRPGIEKLRKEVKIGFNKVDSRFTKLDSKLAKQKVEISAIRDDIKGLKADLSDTPSRKQFEKLKRKVNRYHPTTLPR